MFYANAETAEDRLLAAVGGAGGSVEAVVLDMGATEELDMTSLDILGELVLSRRQGDPSRSRLVRAKVGEMLVKGGLDQRPRIWPTADAAAEARRRT